MSPTVPSQHTAAIRRSDNRDERTQQDLQCPWAGVFIRHYPGQESATRIYEGGQVRSHGLIKCVAIFQNAVWKGTPDLRFVVDTYMRRALCRGLVQQERELQGT